MHRAIALGRTVGNFMAGLVMSGASMADAAVDMTATWRVEATAPGPITIVTYETMVQTGTTLVMSRPVDPPVAFPGTIDPDTGVFQFSFGPAMQSVVEEPGPEVIRQGTVAPDGLTDTAQQNLCIWDYEWACLTFPVTGTRTAFACGNGVVEGAEQCDFGAENGGDCCTTVCAWLDPDDDDVCAAVDNCPDHRNPAQEDWDHDGLGNPCDDTPQGPTSDELVLSGISITARDPAAPVSKLSVKGDTTGPLGVPTALRLTDAGGKMLDVERASLLGDEGLRRLAHTGPVQGDRQDAQDDARGPTERSHGVAHAPHREGSPDRPTVRLAGRLHGRSCRRGAHRSAVELQGHREGRHPLQAVTFSGSTGAGPQARAREVRQIVGHRKLADAICVPPACGERLRPRLAARPDLLERAAIGGARDQPAAVPLHVLVRENAAPRKPKSRRVSMTMSSRAQVPVAVSSPVMSISGWWTRWLDRNVVALMERRKNSRIASRPSKAYLPPLYDAMASSARHSAISSHSFWSRQRMYRYLTRLMSSISTRSAGVMRARYATGGAPGKWRRGAGGVLAAVLLVSSTAASRAAAQATPPGDGMCAVRTPRCGAPPRFAVLSAFPGELRPLLERATVRETLRIGDRVLRVGTLVGVPVVLGLLGIGLVNAEATTALVLDRFDVEGVIVSGVAGAPARIGDVTVPMRWMAPDGTSYDVDPALLRLAERAASRAELARCAPVPPDPPGPDVCVASAGGAGRGVGQQRRSLRRPAGDVPAGRWRRLRLRRCGDRARCGRAPSVVDMETAAAARAAQARRLPFVALRAVSDGAGVPLGLPGFPQQFFAWYGLCGANGAATVAALLEEAGGRRDARDARPRGTPRSRVSCEWEHRAAAACEGERAPRALRARVDRACRLAASDADPAAVQEAWLRAAASAGRRTTRRRTDASCAGALEDILRARAEPAG